MISPTGFTDNCFRQNTNCGGWTKLMRAEGKPVRWDIGPSAVDEMLRAAYENQPSQTKGKQQ
jgi:hypothetical protein